ncbi:tRNA (guanine-N(7)-)-methyltransferase [Camellia lanceoleosa]|uniref:tRNA (Guanine-N(7)-)-methyltransferase n=1 Tax=Camellia lanceoleosa TaxID=1840588 RepID=A0ACC0I7F0_9ERIC|nr:tRNA (guanine-N(7)-)-methyltransferase [Camellia lanceoleosa]
MASLVCAVPRTREALLYSILLSSRFINNPTPKLKSFSIQLSIVPQPHRHCHCHCHCSSSSSSSNGGGVVGVSVGKEEGQLLRSPQLVALEYSDLNLSHNFSQDLGHVRIRQHVNPLCASLSVPAPVPDWSEVYRDSTLPLMVDIGSGSGRFLMWLAKRNLDSKNYLGLEIRKKLVKRAEHWVNELALRNIHFMFANATVSFKQLISTYPGPLMLVSILCPDPHFKKKYHKRRVLQKPLVESIVDSLMPGGQVFIQSDVLEVALDMREKFDAVSDELMHIDKIDTSMLCDDEGWLVSNPMGIRTEREIHAEFEGAKIYRRMYQKRI